MEKQIISIGDDVKHKTKSLNGNIPMTISDIQNNHALCEHFEPNDQGEMAHEKTWIPIDELEKVSYGNGM